MENMLLTACPGSGKTRTVAYKLAFLQKNQLDSHKLHIAITYTNRAADELLSRLENLDVETENIWVGTIHQFCMKFIIRPYAMYSDRVKKGYHVIDEYVQKEHKDEIKKMLGIRDEEWNLDQESKIKIIDEYKKRLVEMKEIDFDNILEISLEILMEKPYVAENIASIIASVQVDEYQDTNEKQYIILSEIYKKNKRIKFSFIGDVNQAIYGSLGGVAKSLEEISNLFETNFKEMHLTGCYRSNQSIIDYYSKFAVEGIKINSMRQNSAEIGTIRLNKEVNKEKLAECVMNIVNDILGKGVKEEDICIVAPRWELIFSLTNKLRKLLPSVRFDAPEITPFKFDAMNPFYLLAKLSFMNQKGHEKARKRYAKEIINILKNDYEININERYDCYNLLEAINSVELSLNADGIECYIEIVAKVMNSLKICLQSEKTLNNCYEQFIRKSKDRIKNHHLSVSCEDLRKCFEEKNGVVINTIHGIKGEEYNSVIAFGLLNGYVPNWNDMNKPDRQKVAYKLLYVLCSRAKERLYLISETGRVTKNRYKHYSITDEIDNIKWNYN